MRPRKVGEPVSTPSNSVSTPPTVITPFLITSSRMVRSCSPLRFLMTESACRTSPAASK